MTITGADAADFAVVAQPPATVAPGGSATFQITCTATTPGVRTATVTIANDDRDEGTFTFAVSAVVTAGPVVTGATYAYQGNLRAVTFQLSRDVGASLAPAALFVRAIDGTVLAPPTAVTFDPSTGTAQFSFTDAPPNANYRATLRAGQVKDASGLPLAADFSFDFFVLAGDVNRDRTVGFSDLLKVAQNYGKAGVGYGGGDLDGDGLVGFSDLLLVAQKYGATLPAPTAAAVPIPVMAVSVPATTTPSASATVGVAPERQPVASVPATSRRPTGTGTIGRRPSGAVMRRPVPGRRPPTGRPAARAVPPPAFGTRRLRRNVEGAVWA